MELARLAYRASDCRRAHSAVCTRFRTAYRRAYHLSLAGYRRVLVWHADSTIVEFSMKGQTDERTEGRIDRLPTTQ